MWKQLWRKKKKKKGPLLQLYVVSYFMSLKLNYEGETFKATSSNKKVVPAFSSVTNLLENFFSSSSPRTEF